MKLYGGGKAPNPRRVSIFVAEKGIEIETVEVDIGKMEHKGEAHTARTDNQKVPVLELDDGTIISETIAICRYLEALHPDPNLLGCDGLEQAKIEMWQRRMEFEILYPVAQAFRHMHPAAVALEPIQVPDWGELNKAHAHKGMAMMDGRLAENEFIAGNKFSIADITAFVAMQFLKPARLQIDESHHNLQRWFEAVSARPSTAW